MSLCSNINNDCMASKISNSMKLVVWVGRKSVT